MTFLKLKEGVRYRKENSGGLIFDSDTAMILEINDEGLEIIKLLKEGISSNSLTNQFGREFEKETEKFLEILRKLNLLREISNEKIS